MSLSSNRLRASVSVAVALINAPSEMSAGFADIFESSNFAARCEASALFRCKALLVLVKSADVDIENPKGSYVASKK